MDEDNVQQSELSQKELILKWLAILGIVATLFFVLLVGLSYSSLSVGQNCGYEKYSDLQYKPLTTSSYTLTNNLTYVLQEFDILFNNNLGYEFCYDVVVNGSNGVKIQLINSLGLIIGSDFLSNSTQHYCTEIVCQDTATSQVNYKHLSVSTDDSESSFNLKPISKQNFIGIKCANCNASNTIQLLEELAGSDVKQIIVTPTNNQVVISDTLSYELVGLQTCKKLIKFWAASYFSFVAFLVLMAFVFVGYDEMKKFFIDDFQKRME